MEIFEKIKRIVVEQLGRDPKEVTLDTTFADLEVDSLDVVELIMSLEEEFEISISDEDAMSFTNMRELVEYIQSKVL